jgi:NADH-quinone oxidoreductase subunit L
MDTSLTLLLLLAPFLGFLFNVFFGKSIGKSMDNQNLLLHRFAVSVYFSSNKSNASNNPNSII